MCDRAKKKNGTIGREKPKQQYGDVSSIHTQKTTTLKQAPAKKNKKEKEYKLASR